MELAFTGQLWEAMARDAFLDALGDQPLKVRILKKDPATLDKALNLVCRLEAIARAPPEETFDDQRRRKDKFAPSSVEAEADRNAEADRRIGRLETTLGEYRHELNRCREENDCLQGELRRQRDQRPPEDNDAWPTTGGSETTRRDAACIVTPYRKGSFDGRATNR